MLLPLTRNFRSSRPVIGFVNAVFSRTMLGGDAEIVYDGLARLNPGRADGEEAPLPEIHILDESAGEDAGDDEALEEIGRAGREAMWIAARIRALRAEQPGLRYRDIAILTRAKSSAAAAMLPVLLSEGIPAYAEGLSGYFDTLEVVFVLSLLRLVDNELRDVEMIGALRSCIAQLTLEELSQIRLAHADMSFAGAARARAEEGEDALSQKLRGFFARLDSWRLRADTLPLGELVRAVCVESGFYTYAGALPGGAQRQANLDALVTRAENFDAEISGSLTRFLGYAEHMRARGDGDSAHLLGEGDDVVRLMTIHKSKGLEFPVVFGALTARSFRGAASGELFRAHRELGLGIHYVDEKLGTRREPLSYLAIGERDRREDAAEELRLLYVLLTRAQQRLILVGSLRNAAARLPIFEATGDFPSAATSHLQLVLGALAAARRAGEAPVASVTVHALDELSGPSPVPEAGDGRAGAFARSAGAESGRTGGAGRGYGLGLPAHAGQRAPAQAHGFRAFARGGRPARAACAGRAAAVYAGGRHDRRGAGQRLSPRLAASGACAPAGIVRSGTGRCRARPAGRNARRQPPVRRRAGGRAAGTPGPLPGRKNGREASAKRYGAP